MQIVERSRSPYNEVDVWETNDGYDFEVAGGTHATWASHRLLTGYAWDAITAATMLRKGPPPRRLLMLGLGGGTALRQIRRLLPKVAITAVEIDDKMVDIARRYMKIDELGLDVVVDDAYRYLENCEERFDIIIDDVYMGKDADVERPRQYDVTLIDLFVTRLARNGILAANVVTGSGHEETRRCVRRAFCDVFEQVSSVKPPKGFNETIVGGSLEPASALHRHGAAFDDPTDFVDWQRLRVRRLRGSSQPKT